MQNKLIIAEPDETLDTISKPPVSILQKKKGYRFSLDPVLLVDFYISTGFKAHEIIDLGTGSGIIPILLCSKKKEIIIKGIELQKSLAKMAERNVILNGMEKQIEIKNCDLKKVKKYFLTESCQAVITNPPFREPSSGRLNEDIEKAIARHEISCNISDVLTAAFFLVKPGGSLFLIYDPRRLSFLIEKMRAWRFEPKIMRFVHSNITSEATMVMISAKKMGNTGVKILKPLFVYEKEKVYTKEIREIYGMC
ncbi:MAG: methyltransferase [Candidatus Schekmanbacteria bacterium]|nr:methyltransferase [Candidatus Schekmanbacteria bacterium]